MTDDLNSFLKEYAGSKKNDSYGDEKKTLGEKFWELWKEYSKQDLSHQSFVYLIQGNKFDADKLLWEYIYEKKTNIMDKAKEKVAEELRDENSARKDRGEAKLSNPPENLRKMLEIWNALTVLESNVTSRDKHIASLKDDNNQLNREKQDLEHKIIRKDEEIEGLKKEIENLRELNSIIARDEAHKVTENYARLAKSLSVCYSTFQETKNMNMSSDLGEVMRNQLRDVFNILSKHEINFGGEK